MALYEDHLFCAEAGRLALCGDDFTCRSGSAPSWSPLSLLNPVLVLPCRCRPVEHADLMAQSEVLEPEGSTRPEDRGQRCEECREKNEHRRELCRKTNSHALKHFEIFERHREIFLLTFLYIGLFRLRDFTSMWKRIFRVIICRFTALHSWVGRRGK